MRGRIAAFPIRSGAVTMFEYAVVIRRQPPKSASSWQLWLASGMELEGPLFLPVMNHAGALGFEAVSAGHFDELAVPEILLQRRIGPAPAPETAAPPAAKPAAKSSAASSARPPAKAEGTKSPARKPAAKKS
jgi:hypothetical protein